MSASAELVKDLSAEAVSAYLAAHPEFFVERSDLLESLRIPHECGGSISLLEKQIDLLRGKRDTLQAQVQTFVDVARDNEQLGLLMHRLSIELMRCDSLDDLLALVRDLLLNEFKSDEVSFLLLDNARGEYSARDPLHFVAPDSKQVEPILRFVRARKTHVTQSNSRQLFALFGDRAPKVKSVAMMPLAMGTEFGILAIGSHNEQRLSSDKGTHFLEQMAELISAALERLLHVPVVHGV